MLAAFRSSAPALRASFLQHLRVSVTGASSAQTSFGVPDIFKGGFSSTSEQAKRRASSQRGVTIRVLDTVKKFKKVNPAKVTLDAHFENDLGLDALDTLELLLDLEEEMKIVVEDEDIDSISTCADVVKYFKAKIRAKKIRRQSMELNEEDL